jgi:hypothetical protein
VHDFVVETRGDRAGRLRFRTFLEAHHHLDFRAEGFAVTFDGFFAVPVEEEVRLNGSVVFCHVHRFGLLFNFVASLFNHYAQAKLGYDFVGINCANPCFLAFHWFDFHFVLLRSPRFDDLAWISNMVVSRPRPLNRQLSSRQLPSIAQLLCRLGTWLVSFQFTYYNERRLVFWTPLFTVGLARALPNQGMTWPLSG